MIGNVKKKFLYVPKYECIDNRVVAFEKVEIGSQVTKLPLATYVHEVSHIEFESNIGYVNEFFNKEVVPIFLEKVCELEIDSTGELLKLQERTRFAQICNCICNIKLQKNKEKMKITMIGIYILFQDYLQKNYLITI